MEGQLHTLSVGSGRELLILQEIKDSQLHEPSQVLFVVDNQGAVIGNPIIESGLEGLLFLVKLEDLEVFAVQGAVIEDIPIEALHT